MSSNGRDSAERENSLSLHPGTDSVVDIRTGEALESAANTDAEGFARAVAGAYDARLKSGLKPPKALFSAVRSKDVFLDAMRHRVGLTYEAEAEEITPDDALKIVLDRTPLPTNSFA